MLNRIVAFIGVFLLVGVILACCVISYQSKRIDALLDAKNSLESNNQLLINKLKKEHNDKLELDKRAKAIEEAIRKDTSGFNWNYDLSGNSVLVAFKRLHAH